MESMEEQTDVCYNENETKSIKPINVDTVHKICSGQVVLSLAIAVKELIENALDAGATIIEVRLKNYGIDLIEVSDNGSGVTEDNFAALTLKYHTSKLSEYSDLLGVSSFGFRGEALSSLCAIANLVITTRHANASYATKIEYNNKGHIIHRTPCSRQIGTTVSLSNLFYSLPVRQKEFHKNAKREFNRMTQLLYAYCLISLGVKITCTNTTTTNSKSVVVATQGSESYRDNIACVFGAKQLQTILQMNQEYVPNIKDNIFKGLNSEEKYAVDNLKIDDVEIDLSEDSNEAESETKELLQSQLSQSSSKSKGYKNNKPPGEFTGFISSCAHGSGRSSTDRQFYFINSRPCEPTKIMKIINETYKQFNPHQYPFVFLNVKIDRSSVDVNVTPDKRKIFLTKEKMIMDMIKTSLVTLFEVIPRSLKVENKDKYNEITDLNEHKAPNLTQPRIFTSFLQKFANKSKNLCENDTTKEIKCRDPDLKRKSTTLLNFISSKTMKIDNNADVNNSSDNDTATTEDECHEIGKDCTINKEVQMDVSLDCKIEIDRSPKVDNNKDSRKIVYLESTENIPNTQIRQLEDIVEKSHTIYCKTKTKNNYTSMKIDNVAAKVVTDKEDLGKQSKKSILLKTSLEHVKALYELSNKHDEKNCENRVRFRSQINPVFNKKCEEELLKEISKESFKEMSVVGQFNLGFIIARLDEDLFIIDQHATDEIYNFETLQRTTELTSQKLVFPQQLELTGVNEQILMDNLHIFKKNGFTFDINPTLSPTKRVKLVTLPMSKNWVFGKEDIEELLFMLRESPNESCRPSRVRTMFASRACRKSVMIGTALSKFDMKTLVNHMAEIDNPWNCPHGRPTIRHLVNLNMVQVKEN